MARAGMERWRGRLALVTGASGGIGAAVARALVQQGLKVVGCARTVGNIEELAAECKSAGYPGTLIPYRCDLSNEEDILSMFSAVRSQHGGVDICINNAGLARPDTLLSGSTSGWKNMFNVNVLALSICTREAYQSMKERNVDDGHIININSMSGHRVPPNSITHFYSATKYTVTALTEGLRQELREAQTHIRATCISPGVVETQFAFKLHDKDPEKAAATYEIMKCLKPEDVAEAVIYVLGSPPHVQVHQGVCLEVSPLRPQPCREAGKVGPGDDHQQLCLVLEGLQDPRNLGAVLRSAHFLGVDKVIISRRNSCPLTPVVSKASAGAMEVMDVFSTDDLAGFLQAKAQQGWLVAGTVGFQGSESSHSSKTPTTSCLEFLWDRPTLLVLGNEGSGLSQEVQASCQLFLTILPGRQLPPGLESLNVSVAAGILLHSICSQRKGFPEVEKREKLLQDSQEPPAVSEGLRVAQHPELSSGSEKERQNGG